MDHVECENIKEHTPAHTQTDTHPQTHTHTRARTRTRTHTHTHTHTHSYQLSVKQISVDRVPLIIDLSIKVTADFTEKRSLSRVTAAENVEMDAT